MVAGGNVQHEDLIGNNGADTVADFGRIRQHDAFFSVRRALFRARRHWCPITIDTNKFMVALSRTEVNHAGRGGTAPDVMTWDKGSIFKPRASSLRVMTIDHESLPGPPWFLDTSWCSLSSSLITQEDVAVWSFSVDILSLLPCISQSVPGYTRRVRDAPPRSPTGTDEGKGQGGSGARVVRWPTGTEASTPGEAARSPDGA